MSDVTTINSREYWERRFKENWRERRGVEQTRFFAELLASHLPAWFITDVRRHQLSLCDWGCAEGEAVFCLGQFFSGHQIVGIDYASAAIEKARAKFPGFEFSAADWVADPAPKASFDVVVSSNVLEHFHDPLRILREVLGRAARKFIVLLLPFAEDPDRMDPEHFFRFLKNNLPLAWDNWICGCFEVIRTATLPETHWFGEQALVIYADRDWLRESQLNLTLAGLPGDSAILGERLQHEYEGEMQRLAAETAGLRENLAMARQSLSEQQIAYEDKLHDLSDRLREALDKCEAATRAEAAARQSLLTLEPLAVEAAGLRENLAMSRQSLSEQKMAYEDKLHDLSERYRELSERLREALDKCEAATRAEAAARQSLLTLEPLAAEAAGLRENLAMARQSLLTLEPLAAEAIGLRENLAMARQALSEQQIAYENKLQDFSGHYQQMSRDRDEALADDAVARRELIDAYGRLVGLREEVLRQRQRLTELKHQHG